MNGQLSDPKPYTGSLWKQIFWWLWISHSAPVAVKQRGARQSTQLIRRFRWTWNTVPWVYGSWITVEEALRLAGRYANLELLGSPWPIGCWLVRSTCPVCVNGKQNWKVDVNVLPAAKKTQCTRLCVWFSGMFETCDRGILLSQTTTSLISVAWERWPCCTRNRREIKLILLPRWKKDFLIQVP